MRKPNSSIAVPCFMTTLSKSSLMQRAIRSSHFIKMLRLPWLQLLPALVCPHRLHFAGRRITVDQHGLDRTGVLDLDTDAGVAQDVQLVGSDAGQVAEIAQLLGKFIIRPVHDLALLVLARIEDGGGGVNLHGYLILSP